MKTLSLCLALILVPVAAAAAPPPHAHGNQSGADAFRYVVVECLTAGLESGAVTDPVALANQCVEAAQVIWAAAYGGQPCLSFNQ